MTRNPYQGWQAKQWNNDFGINQIDCFDMIECGSNVVCFAILFEPFSAPFPLSRLKSFKLTFENCALNRGINESYRDDLYYALRAHPESESVIGTSFIAKQSDFITLQKNNSYLNSGTPLTHYVLEGDDIWEFICEKEPIIQELEGTDSFTHAKTHLSHLLSAGNLLELCGPAREKVPSLIKADYFKEIHIEKWATPFSVYSCTHSLFLELSNTYLFLSGIKEDGTCCVFRIEFTTQYCHQILATGTDTLKEYEALGSALKLRSSPFSRFPASWYFEIQNFEDFENPTSYLIRTEDKIYEFIAPVEPVVEAFESASFEDVVQQTLDNLK